MESPVQMLPQLVLVVTERRSVVGEEEVSAVIGAAGGLEPH